MNPLYRLPEPAKQPELAVFRAFTLGVLTLLAFFEVLTQVFAHRLFYSPLLGPPFLTPPNLSPRLYLLTMVLLGASALVCQTFERTAPALLALASAAALAPLALGGRLYGPLQILVWLFRFRNSAALAGRVHSFGQLAFAGSLVVLAVTFLAVARLAYRAENLDLHGSARFAVQADVESTGLLGQASAASLAGGDGIYLGVWNQGRQRLPLVVQQDRNVFLMAPSRSGKGVGVVVPTLLSWRGSVVVHDMKRELANLSAGFRREELGQIVLLFDPTHPDTSSRFNPLAEIRRGDFEVRDAQNVADVLIDPSGERKPDHWSETAHDLLSGLILHVLYAEPNKTLTGCAEFLSRPGLGIRQALTAMRDFPHFEGKPHPAVSQTAQAMLNKADEELSGVVSTAVTCLRLYRDPLIARVTAASDFQLRDLLDSPIPVSLYLIVPASDQSRTHPLMRLLLNQMSRRLVEEMQFDSGRSRPPTNRLALLLDEFPSLGRLPSFQKSLGFFAGYGISTLIVSQDISQLRGLYGASESITPNCDYRVAFAPNMPDSAKLLSDLCGDSTVHHRHLSRRLGGSLGQATSTPTEIRRPLLTVDEALRLSAHLALVLANGQRPILAERLRYYEDPEFLRRSRIPSPVMSDRLSPENPWVSGPPVSGSAPGARPPHLADLIPRRAPRRAP